MAEIKLKLEETERASLLKWFECTDTTEWSSLHQEDYDRARGVIDRLVDQLRKPGQ